MTEKQFQLRQVTDYTIEYHSPNGETCKTIPNILQLVENDLNTLCKDKEHYHKLLHMTANKIGDLIEENQQIKNTIREAYKNERTQLGQSVLRQLLEQME